ncbi:hypothetical protein [Kitasatospora viridis]|uniref:Uncharacterized protein n=1 Tax=Kitasatospora viridis TaxID=281105 RepID=A0A561UPT5_9ACTN|nr:hypothetical protein [Kitasatospora viridis]TWG01351.1 hypothetical protein FHX73_115244 [Kitasatospora viridis]
MSVIASFQSVQLSRPRTRSLRAAFAQAVQRLAESPFDSPVLHAVTPDGPQGGSRRLRARWESVTAADGATRLACRWTADR